MENQRQIIDYLYTDLQIFLTKEASRGATCDKRTLEEIHRRASQLLSVCTTGKNYVPIFRKEPATPPEEHRNSVSSDSSTAGEDSDKKILAYIPYTELFRQHRVRRLFSLFKCDFLPKCHSRYFIENIATALDASKYLNTKQIEELWKMGTGAETVKLRALTAEGNEQVNEYYIMTPTVMMKIIYAEHIRDGKHLSGVEVYTKLYQCVYGITLDICEAICSNYCRLCKPPAHLQKLSKNGLTKVIDKRNNKNVYCGECDFAHEDSHKFRRHVSRSHPVSRMPHELLND